MHRVVLVTGASSGIGRATARLLAGRGYAVFGTSRNPKETEPVPGVRMLPLDVRSDESVASCVRAVLSEAGRLDVLVNNAGYVLAAPLEATPLEEAKAQFETNFWGVVRMTNAVLPHMRARRDGRILIVGSLAGVVPLPFEGFYSATKFALEGYAEALHHEVGPFGIRVSLVEPGFVRTPLGEHARYLADGIPDYEPSRQRLMGAVRRSLERGTPPERVAHAVLRLLERRAPPLRRRVGQDAAVVYWLRRLLPERAFAVGLRRMFSL